MASLNDDIQIVCDLKLVSILLGIQTATYMHSCPYCDYFKLNCEKSKSTPGANTKRLMAIQL